MQSPALVSLTFTSLMADGAALRNAKALEIVTFKETAERSTRPQQARLPTLISSRVPMSKLRGLVSQSRPNGPFRRTNSVPSPV